MYSIAPRHHWLAATALVIASLGLSAKVFADGSETLGTPSIPIESGTGFVAKGVGLAQSQPGDIELTIPAGATVKQVLLYWQGFGLNSQSDGQVTLNGIPVAGVGIGGPDLYFEEGGPNNPAATWYSTVYRADITALAAFGGVGPGTTTTFKIGGMDFNKVNNGAGIMAIIDDGSGTTELELRDGDDIAWIGWPEPRKTTVPQTFTFDAAPVDRTATVTMFFASVKGNASGTGNLDRPSLIKVTVGGVTQNFDNLLGATDGEEWDTLVLNVAIPAGATEMTIQALSENRLGVGNGGVSPNPASMVWLATGVTVPTTARLGDRVWEDLDRDGIQDCEDVNGNGVIGDNGDSGPECGAGIPNVPVELFAGDCTTSLGRMVMTDQNGFYLFDGLAPGDYCVKFGLPDETFCDTDGFQLGAPKFTLRNEGDDAKDSDADPADGTSGSVNLIAGESDLTVDAGVYCPAKIGDYVWFDEDEDGIQDTNETGVEGVKTILYECGDDMIAGTADDILVGQMRTTGTDGMYMYGAEDTYDLPPGKYFVKFDETTLPPGTTFTTPKVGTDDTVDSDCRVPGGITACTDLTASRSINLDRDCGIVRPPACELTLDKTCLVEPPPPEPFDKCDGKLQQFTLVWTGAGTITAAGPNNTVVVGKDGEATFVGPFKDNDVIVSISGAVTGESKFHVSCSDEDFNDPSDCGKMAGDGKSNESGLINDWLLEGFVDANGRVLDCTPTADGGFANNCTYEPPAAPSCETVDKVQTLVLEYTGGGCTESDNSQDAGKAVCTETGPISGEVSITAAGREQFDGDIYTVDPVNVQPGGRFSISFGGSDLKSTSFVKLYDGLNTETNELHTSCSQTLEVGDVFGSLTVVGLNGQDGGVDVTYAYDVKNLGDTLTDVSIVDDPLGTIASGLTLVKGDSRRFTVMERIFGTTTNSAQASGTLANGDVCKPASASDTVTVTAVIPPCSVGITLDRVEDDKLKLKLKNTDTRNRIVTLDTLAVEYPADRGAVKEIKLDGAIFKNGDQSNVVNPLTVGPGDWTQSDVTKRQLDPGETRTLEIVTYSKTAKDTADFEVLLKFEEGCEYKVSVTDKQIVVTP